MFALFSLALVGATAAHSLPTNAFMDPLSLYLLTKNGGSSDISLLMMMQQSDFGNDYGINPLLLTSLLDDDDDSSSSSSSDFNKDDLMKVILISGMSSQYPDNDFSGVLPLMMMGGENMSPLMFAAMSSRFSGNNGGPEQWAMMKWFARRTASKKASCQANLASGATDCFCKSKFADYEIFMPETQEGFFGLAQMLDEVECKTSTGADCYCCYESKSRMELMMEFMMQPIHQDDNQKNAWVELFKYKQDNKCDTVQDDAGQTCYCKAGHSPMMSQNPMYAFFFNNRDCFHDDGTECLESACKACAEVGTGLDAMLPFLLTSGRNGAGDMGQNFMDMQSMYPFLLEDTTCDVGGNTCNCDDKMDQMLSLMMIGNNGLNNNPMVTMMMMNDKDTCKGNLAGTTTACECPKSMDKLPLLLMMSQNNAATNAMHIPRARSMSAKKFMFLQNSDAASKAAINDMFNYGFRTNDADFNKAFMMVRSGFPAGMVRMMLSKDKNFGGAADTNQEALINYFVSSGLATMESAPMYVKKFKNIDVGGDATAFYISQLLDQGKIDPFMGFLQLARRPDSGMTKSDINAVFKSINFGKTSLLSDWAHGFQFVPEDLPSMVYPGAKLNFAHLETLGVDTCSIIAPDLRIQCGFDGITAAQCETKPYCCYNPILSSDAEYEDTPWCYYNVYQLKHDEAFVEIQKPGQFMNPSTQCAPLFKHGLNLPAELYMLKGSSEKLINERNECGFPGITEFHCRAILGCCWDDANYGFIAAASIPQCYSLKAGGTKLPDIPKNAIPPAYQPTTGTCNTNYYQIPQLFDDRRPCYYSAEQATARNMDPLDTPNEFDCLSILGCCWEDRDEVVSKFRHSPRCYMKHNTNSGEVQEGKAQLDIDNVINSVKAIDPALLKGFQIA